MITSFVIIALREDPGTDAGGHNISINDHQAYYRPYDGSDTEEVTQEAAEALGALLRERLGHPVTRETGCPDCNIRHSH